MPELHSLDVTANAITVRPCIGFQELDDCVDIQEQVWGYEERDIIPRRLFVVAQRIGGQIFGAFLDHTPSRMVGFAMALPALRNGHPYLHSHMLAVLPQWRNASIGRRLKLAQREDALARGIKLMEWTFDPLEIKNAFLNIHRLGAVVRSYTPDFYGPLHSELQAGLQSDRLHAEWWLDSPRVIAALSGKHPAIPAAAKTIVVPSDVARWKLSPEERPKAVALQSENRKIFLKLLSEGQAVVGLTRDEQGNGIYHLAPPSQRELPDAAFSTPVPPTHIPSTLRQVL